jgi:hypothetical protein
MMYVVDLYGEDGQIGDCLPTIFATREDAVAAAEAALKEHAEERARGLRDQVYGWAFFFELREVEEEE